MVDNILLAVDGSENSLRAAEFTVDLLQSMPGTGCTAVIVTPFTEDEALYLGTRPAAYDRARENKVQPELEKVRRIFRSQGQQLKTAMLMGDVAKAIADYARKNRHDIIIMGTRGLGNIKGMLLGSVSYKVMKLAHCPVTVVK